MAANRVSVRIGEDVIVVELVGDREVRIHTDSIQDGEVTPLGNAPGAYRVRIGERSAAVYVAGPPNQRWVFCGGRADVVEVDAEGRARAKPTAAHGDSLSAPMPATVTRIVVAPGDRVTRGDTLLTLEAMKMELPIRAPHDGVVARIHCHEGDLVQPGASLLDFA